MLNTHRNIIYTISFLDLFAIGLVVPLFNNHLKSLGVSHFTIGLIGSTYSGLQILSGPIIGSWSDVGNRKKVLIFTLIACCISYLTLGVVSSITFIFIARIILGSLKHTQGLCKAMISDLFPHEKFAELLSKSAVLGTIGFSLGPLIGGYLSELSNGFFYVCFLTALLFVLNIGISLFLPDFDQLKSKKNTARTLKEEIKKIGLNIKAVNWIESWKAFAVRFLFGISVAFYYHHEAVYLKEEFDLKQKHIGVIISLQGILQTISVYSNSYVKNFIYKNETSCVKRLSHTFILMTFSLFSLWLINDVIIFILFAIPFRISSSILRITTMEFLLENCRKDQIGTFGGVSNSVMSVGRFIAPVFSGIVCDNLNNRSPFVLAFVSSFIGTFLVFKSLKNDKTTIKNE